MLNNTVIQESLLNMVKDAKKIFERNKYMVSEEISLLKRINILPKQLQNSIGDFSQAVQTQKQMVREQYYEQWLEENEDRIMRLVDKWPKEKIGRVLNAITNHNRILTLRPNNDDWLKGGYLYNMYTAKFMKLEMIILIADRSKHRRLNVDIKMRNNSLQTRVKLHQYAKSKLDLGKFEDTVVREYAAYKAIEDYDTKIAIKKIKK
jgi:hypothetical protein